MKRRFFWLLTISLMFGLTLGCIQPDHQASLSSNHPLTAPSDLAQSIYLPPRQDLRIAVISDLNSQYGSTEYEPEVTKAIDLIINRWQPDLVLGGGDAIAGQKTSLTLLNQLRYQIITKLKKKLLKMT